LQLTVTPAQLGELFLLRAGQSRRTTILVGVGLGHPVPQTRLADTEILRQHGNRFVALTGQLNRPTAELGWVWCRHQDILPDGRGHLTSGVRATGSSSGLAQNVYTGINAYTGIK